MNRVLVTAFDSYGEFEQNASWLALVEMTKELPTAPEVTTRLYPVDFAAMEARLRVDLELGFDVAIHLGQAPGSAQIQIETIAVNVAQDWTPEGQSTWQLVPDGPTAYQTRLPAQLFADRIRQADIPAGVSFHAGTYLCNGIFYMSQFFAEQMKLPTKSIFVHVPLATSQVAALSQTKASLPTETTAKAISLIVEEVGRLQASEKQL